MDLNLTGRFVLGAVLSLAVGINQSAHAIVRVAVAPRRQAALQQQYQTVGITAMSTAYEFRRGRPDKKTTNIHQTSERMILDFGRRGVITPHGFIFFWSNRRP